MTKETLMEMGLTEEQATQVMSSLDGDFVTKARFNEVNTALKAAQNDLKDRDAQLEQLKAAGTDAQTLQAQIAQLQADNAAAAQAHEAEIRQLRIDNAVERALTEAGAINPVTVRPLLNSLLEKAELNEDGSVKGLTDEIAKLAKTEGTSFLFRVSATTPTVSGATPAGSITSTPTPQGTTYEAQLAAARKAGNTAAVVQIKRQAAAEGIQIKTECTESS